MGGVGRRASQQGLPLPPRDLRSTRTQRCAEPGVGSRGSLSHRETPVYRDPRSYLGGPQAGRDHSALAMAPWLPRASCPLLGASLSLPSTLPPLSRPVKSGSREVRNNCPQEAWTHRGKCPLWPGARIGMSLAKMAGFRGARGGQAHPALLPPRTCHQRSAAGHGEAEQGDPRKRHSRLRE